MATGSLPVTICACSACAGLVLTAWIARDAWQVRRGRRALARAAAVGKPERAWLTDDERGAWLGIILKSYSNEELDYLTRRGEQLRANRGRS